MSGDTEEDTKARLGKARTACNKLGKTWKNSQFTILPRLMSSRCCCMIVKPGEWVEQTRKRWMCSYIRASVGYLSGIYWPMGMTNEEIRTRAGIETISKQVAKRRWTWLGHVLRMDHHSHPQIPEGIRNRGRPRETWRRTVGRELGENGLRTWAEAASAEEDRAACRQRVAQFSTTSD